MYCSVIMAKPIFFLLGAIPVIAAILLAVPLVTKNEIPVSAANSFDKIEIEYTKHQLKKISNGIAERTGSQKTEILLIGPPLGGLISILLVPGQ